jgi:hypothetical protein
MTDVFGIFFRKTPQHTAVFLGNDLGKVAHFDVDDNKVIDLKSKNLNTRILANNE